MDILSLRSDVHIQFLKALLNHFPLVFITQHFRAETFEDARADKEISATHDMNGRFGVIDYDGMISETQLQPMPEPFPEIRIIIYFMRARLLPRAFLLSDTTKVGVCVFCNPGVTKRLN